MTLPVEEHSAAPAPPRLFGLTRDELAGRIAAFGEPAYRADQVMTWVYRKRQRDAAAMTNLPARLRERLTEVCRIELDPAVSVLGTKDGLTHKFVIGLAGGARVESVSMQTERRLTYCISSQVGCALKCAFCATGLMGLERHLTAAEIVGQVVVMGDRLGWKDDRFNIVFMGMGEPLHNYDPVLQAIRVLHDPRGLNIGARRITVSTSGMVPQMKRLATEGLALGLALSLHATTDELRNELVPINKRWPLAEVIEASKEYGRATGRRVTLEYTLLAGVNDRMEDADRLARIARDLPSKINLIPYNPVPGMPWKRPSPEAVEAFARRLHPQAPAVTVRNTLGGEIWAACGQLGAPPPNPRDTGAH